ncbi:hypothetical protein STCU_08880 [Strigomonas culicis]|uniref:Uncharacterized protein n=1 Tax=Strigomonas culicis TaxID=28005 RepID=S9TVT7_9TRYP|nr:hypothetical protein STCU_08880 [Strigomonas culicis]|eukprot:EPY20689.1 hypothetical protein STCU_08880 [Strigomonas culicis]
MEQLRFSINGKSIVYDGNPKNRSKDLINILVKMGISGDRVVTTFRDNIEDEGKYTDSKIQQMYEAARVAREERKSGKDKTAAAEKPAPEKAAEAEKVQKITLLYKSRQFSFEGLPSSKQHAVIQLLIKQPDMTPAVAVETFRANLPDSAATDDEIWGMVQESKAARASRKAGGAAPARPLPPPRPWPLPPPHPRATTGRPLARPPRPSPPTCPPVSTRQEHVDPQVQQFDAIEKYTGVSAEERMSIDKFIEQVLNQPVMNVEERLRENPKARGNDDENTDLLLTQRTKGKIVVYCQEEKQQGTKLVHATPTMSFEEFSQIVESKYGRKMALSFYEDDDVIEIDDDNVFAMFLENCQQNGKKVKLICSNPADRRHVAEDNITEGTAAAQTGTAGAVATKSKAVAFSNGELSVNCLRTYNGHSSAVYCCSFSPNGEQFLTASRDRSVRLWNAQTGSCTPMKGGHNGFVLSCDISPKSNRAVSSADDNTIKVWNTTTCNKVATLKGHDSKVYCVKYNTLGDYIVSGSCDQTVRVWNAETFSKVVTLRGHKNAVFSCCFSNKENGKFVASGSDDRLIKIWDWANNKEVVSLLGHVGTVWSVAFSNQDQYLISTSMDHELKLWDAKTGACVRSLAGHNVPIHNALFSPDDKYIYSCARDCGIMVWRTEDGELVETIVGHQSTVYHLDVRENKLLSSSLDNNIKLWEITPKKTAA